jgi:catecholate siderophore receptor
VSKVPRLITEHEITTTLGSHDYGRVTGDFNFKTGEDAALRINADGATRRQQRLRAAASTSAASPPPTARASARPTNSSPASITLDNQNGINYGLPWIKPKASRTPAPSNTVIGSLIPTATTAWRATYNNGGAKVAPRHIHRFDGGSELRTQVRRALRARPARQRHPLRRPGAGPVQLRPGTVLHARHQPEDPGRGHAARAERPQHEVQRLGVQHECRPASTSRARKDASTPRAPRAGRRRPGQAQHHRGTPDDGAWIDEGLRVLRTATRSSPRPGARTRRTWCRWRRTGSCWAACATTTWTASTTRFDIPANCARAVTPPATSRRSPDWSQRFGVLLQRTAPFFHCLLRQLLQHLGDTYSYNALSANTPPEQSENSSGAKADSEADSVLDALALFRRPRRTSATPTRTPRPPPAAVRQAPQPPASR